MSLTKDAIEHIQQSVAMKQALEALSPHKTAMPIVALSGDLSVHNLEQYMPGRARFRGAMTTNTMEAFTAYARKHKAESAACFVDGEKMKASVIFDVGNKEDPGHCGHTASISAEKLAEYRVLLGVNGDRLNQKEVAEWVEDWRENLTAVNAAGELLDIAHVTGALRLITIEEKRKSEHEQGDVRAVRTTMEEIEAKSEKAIPAVLSFTCRPYECIAMRTFDMRLSILTSHDKPMFILRIKQLEKHEEEMAFEFTELVKSGLDDTGIETYMGKFNP